MPRVDVEASTHVHNPPYTNIHIPLHRRLQPGLANDLISNINNTHEVKTMRMRKGTYVQRIYILKLYRMVHCASIVTHSVLHASRCVRRCVCVCVCVCACVCVCVHANVSVFVFALWIIACTGGRATFDVAIKATLRAL